MRWSWKSGIEKMSNLLVKQFQRIYTDDGRNDRDFTTQEELLQQAQNKLTRCAQDLTRASENLNRAAISAGLPKTVRH